MRNHYEITETLLELISKLALDKRLTLEEEDLFVELSMEYNAYILPYKEY